MQKDSKNIWKISSKETNLWIKYYVAIAHQKKKSKIKDEVKLLKKK